MFCKTCMTSKEASAFYACNKSRCKECIKASVNAYRQENLERIRSYDKFRGSMPHRVAARKEYAQTPEGKAAHRRAHQASYLRYPERKKATETVSNAVRDGRLQKQPCWVCGEQAQAHHPDYSRPLDVVWLCVSHHRQAHALVAA